MEEAAGIKKETPMHSISRLAKVALGCLAALLLQTVAPAQLTTRQPVPVVLLAPKVFPLVLGITDPSPKLLVLVHNVTPVAREIHAQALVYSPANFLLDVYRLSADVGAGERALLITTLYLNQAIGTIHVRAFAGDPTLPPLRVPNWLSVSKSEIRTWIDGSSDRRAQASVEVHNRSRADVYIRLRFRFYSSANYQVAICFNEPRPIYTHYNILVPRGVPTRVGCEVGQLERLFEKVADVPVRLKVELVGLTPAR
jgi:hypothetical protein